MDQARDPVTGRPATPPVDVTQTSGDPEAIADDIRETRAELSDTISQIGDKLDPRHLVDDAKDALFSAGRDAGTSMIDQVKNSSVLDTIKDNPLPAMAVGLSVAWFLSKVGESESDRYRAEQYRITGDPYYAPRYAARGYRYGSEYRGYGDPRPVGTYGTRSEYDGASGGHDDESLVDKASDALDSVKDKASDALDTAKDKASHAVDAAKDKASDLSDSASRTAHGARDRASGAGQSMRRYERRAESWLDDQMQRNPLAVGAVALAAGALVGLSVPETDAEHRAFGDEAEAARDRLTSAAQSAARGATEKVTSAAQDVADDAADKAKKVGKEAESKAKKVGSKAEDRAGSVADSAKGDIEDAKNKAASKTSASKTKGSLDLSSSPTKPLPGTATTASTTKTTGSKTRKS